MNSKELEHTVSIARCSRYHPGDIRESLEQLLKPWGGIRSFIKPAQRVLLKPNLLTAVSPEEAVTTHPVLIHVLAEMIREAGGKVFIGDSPGSLPPEQVYRATGIEAAAQATGAGLLHFNALSPVNPGGSKRGELPLTAALTQVDLVINVGKLKTHTLTGLTGAVKNCYGCIAGRHKRRLHFEHPLPLDFAGLLLDIYLAVQPRLSILDAIVAMEGTGPRSGSPRQAGLLLASVNGIALDRVAAMITGFDEDEVTTNLVAQRRKLYGAAPAPIRIEGISLEKAKINGFDRGAVAAGRVGRLLSRFPGSWLRNLLRQRRRPYPEVDPERCSGCANCLTHCPPQIIRIKEKKALIDPRRCIRCYCCHELCPNNAIKLLPG